MPALVEPRDSLVKVTQRDDESYFLVARQAVILSEAKDLDFGRNVRSRDPSLRSG
jgi:hypothetical protein